MKTVTLTIIALSALTACSRSITYLPLDSSASLADHVDQNIEIRGHVSNIIWQHMTGYFKDYPESNYFDIGDFQTVIYSQEPIKTKRIITVQGKVVKITGPGRRPEQEKETKVDDSYSEYHILVDDWR